MFDPKTNKFPYPVDTDRHYLVVKKDNGNVYDKNYPYIDDSRKYRAGYLFTRTLLYLFVFPLSRIRLGLKFVGRENLKKHAEVIKNGVISCCNHVHMWDYISIMNGVKPIRTRILSWDKNISGENGWLIRHVGGIPIPENDIRATASYIKAISNYVQSGGWLHIYPEGSMWEFYAPIRPFKHGVAHFACRFDRPVIPMAFSYREPGWIRKNIFHQIAKFTLHIGEPIFRNEELPQSEQELDLTRRCHAAVCRLAGIYPNENLNEWIDPNENIYEPVFNDSKRIDYYTDTYGVGYKGSW